MNKTSKPKRSAFSWLMELAEGRRSEYVFSILVALAGVACSLFPYFRQYRTKSVWRLCTPSACKFSVIFHKNAREYIKYSLRFLFHLTENLTTHLPHNLCAVLPQIFQISFAYSLTARSAEKMPALAMLCRDILVHVSLSVYSLELCSCT